MLQRPPMPGGRTCANPPGLTLTRTRARRLQRRRQLERLRRRLDTINAPAPETPPISRGVMLKLWQPGTPEKTVRAPAEARSPSAMAAVSAAPPTAETMDPGIGENTEGSEKWPHSRGAGDAAEAPEVAYQKSEKPTSDLPSRVFDLVYDWAAKEKSFEREHILEDLEEWVNSAIDGWVKLGIFEENGDEVEFRGPEPEGAEQEEDSGGEEGQGQNSDYSGQEHSGGGEESEEEEEGGGGSSEAEAEPSEEEIELLREMYDPGYGDGIVKGMVRAGWPYACIREWKKKSRADQAGAARGPERHPSAERVSARGVAGGPARRAPPAHGRYKGDSRDSTGSDRPRRSRETF